MIRVIHWPGYLGDGSSQEGDPSHFGSRNPGRDSATRRRREPLRVVRNGEHLLCADPPSCGSASDNRLFLPSRHAELLRVMKNGSRGRRTLRVMDPASRTAFFSHFGAIRSFCELWSSNVKGKPALLFFVWSWRPPLVF
ncbi:hypothetical protein R1flu_010320 [Riccia fluitans]|uniref:Uncharacterized protein n=1 Tax=Riccia fluitans TaxID=41844 RepID=A0ABD1Z4N3_9MARC